MADLGPFETYATVPRACALAVSGVWNPAQRAAHSSSLRTYIGSIADPILSAKLALKLIQTVGRILSQNRNDECYDG